MVKASQQDYGTRFSDPAGTFSSHRNRTSWYVFGQTLNVLCVQTGQWGHFDGHCGAGL